MRRDEEKGLHIRDMRITGKNEDCFEEGVLYKNKLLHAKFGLKTMITI